MRTILENSLIILLLDLPFDPEKGTPFVTGWKKNADRWSGTDRHGDVVVYAKDDKLRGDVSYTNVVENIRIIERDFSGH
jgi:hypothetical protein